MRLRTRLALAFALLAVVPLALVVPRAIGEVRGILSKDLESRLQSVRTGAETAVQETGRDALRAGEEIAGSVALEDFARELRAQGPSNQRLAVAKRLMDGRNLSVLSLFDAEGKTLSSGHLPARVGDPDPALFAATQNATQGALPVLVDLRGEAGVHRYPALVAARSFEYGELGIWGVGGRGAGLVPHLPRRVFQRGGRGGEDLRGGGAGAGGG